MSTCNDLDIVFLKLLGVGIGTYIIENVNTTIITKLTQADWELLRKMADKQGVTALTFDGLNRLIETYGKDCIAPNIDSTWWQRFILDWIGATILIEEQNKKQIEVMNEMASIWKSESCKVMVFKGQANAIMYPKPNHRNPGDIDCYLFDNYAKGNLIARKIGANVNENWYKHSVITYRGETFENHQYLVCTRGGKRYKVLENELVKFLNHTEDYPHFSSSVVLPPEQWTAMFLTYHACGHFLSEGLRMKQIIDWALFLKEKQGAVDWKSYYDFCEKTHHRKIAEALTQICVDYLGLIITAPDITYESPYSEKVLRSTLHDDDYVYGSGKSSWYNRWHLMKNIFVYRWKYEDIYDESIWRKVWYNVTGFLFHTEQ